MTIIESFEKTPIENMLSTLASKPEKVIFLGDNSQMKRHMEVYKKFLDAKGIATKICTRSIQKNNLINILEVLTELVETEEECIFDVTGGEDLVLLGFGIIYERYKNQKMVKLQRFNLNTGRVVDCDCDNEVSFTGAFSLDVKELISLYGGVVVPEDPQPMVDNAVEEVDKLWEIARKNSSKWNREMSYLKEFEKKGNVLEDELEMKLEFQQVKGKIADYPQKYQEVVRLLQKLAERGLVHYLEIDRDRISYKYKNSFVKRCLVKAGDALEMKSYMEALSMMDKDKPFFNDCYVGVEIDWDGIIHSKEEHWKDTTNEIDLMLMRGLTPVFVSCKNGKIGEEELYKLNTVATRFGGKYAKKMLIATKLDRETEIAQKSYIQRAKDMGIMLVPNAGELSKEEWKRIFRQVIG